VSEWRKIWANGLPSAGRSPKSGHRMAAKGIQFPRRWYGGMTSANLEVIWAMSAKTLSAFRPKRDIQRRASVIRRCSDVETLGAEGPLCAKTRHSVLLICRSYPELAAAFEEPQFGTLQCRPREPFTALSSIWSPMRNEGSHTRRPPAAKIVRCSQATNAAAITPTRYGLNTGSNSTVARQPSIC